MTRRSRARLAVLLVALAASGVSSHAARAQSCNQFDPLRMPFFGDLHVHTAASFDAYRAEVREGAREAYLFAKGFPIGLPPYVGGVPTRTMQLRRPLDFAAVTDHAEMLGETNICTAPGLPPGTIPACAPFEGPSSIEPFLQLFTSDDPERLAFCGEGGLICLAAAMSVWADQQAAADEHYDRSATCAFTTFKAYEWTGAPGSNVIHRNVVFAGDAVPDLPFSHVEVPQPAELWDILLLHCKKQGVGCDAIAIPHNSNLSNGFLFPPPGSFTAAEARDRAQLEPLVELMQHKGDSECRNGVNTADEQCDFEKKTVAPPASDPPLNYVRNALLAGLEFSEAIGINPYRLGFIGGTDTHNATAGATREDEYEGHGGDFESSVVARLQGTNRYNNPGGLAVLWAEENTRESLFAAMRRREAYSTSGTRPVLRFFGGFDYPDDLCDATDFVAQGYANGVPMGGEIGPASAGQLPRFAVSALADPGPAGLPGALLQRVQIVKGWLDSNGVAHEQVFDVAGSEQNGASVDLATCAVSGADYQELCSVWTDVDFEIDQPAFYYARVLENETCRWSQWQCNASGIDCSAPPVPAGFEPCCDPSIPATIQERAVSSPIWYRTLEPLAAPALPIWALGSLGGLLLGASALGLRRAAGRRASPRTSSSRGRRSTS